MTAPHTDLAARLEQCRVALVDDLIARGVIASPLVRDAFAAIRATISSTPS